jgi:hypothetical protein
MKILLSLKLQMKLQGLRTNADAPPIRLQQHVHHNHQPQHPSQSQQQQQQLQSQESQRQVLVSFSWISGHLSTCVVMCLAVFLDVSVDDLICQNSDAMRISRVYTLKYNNGEILNPDNAK